MRVLLSVLAVGAAIGLVLFALGVFDDTPTPDAGRAPAADPVAKGSAGGGGGATALEGGREPAEEPDHELQPFASRAGVLLLSQRPTTWSRFLGGAVAESRELRYATWYTDSFDARDVKAGAGPGPQRDMELKAMPTAADLGTLDIEILIVDGIDPNVFPGDFWDAVTKRVGNGDMGLWVRPGYPVGPAGEAQTAHPMLSHPGLSALLPVAEAAPLEGNPVPGTFPQGVSMALTPAGAKHPATRITPFPKWARHFWDQRTLGDYAWKPAFCYPVKKLAPRAISLVDVKATAIDRSPAFIVSSPDVGRVLWQGIFDFGQRAYYSAAGTKPIGILVNRMLLWLAGRAEE